MRLGNTGMGMCGCSWHSALHSRVCGSSCSVSGAVGTAQPPWAVAFLPVSPDKHNLLCTGLPPSPARSCLALGCSFPAQCSSGGFSSLHHNKGKLSFSTCRSMAEDAAEGSTFPGPGDTGRTRLPSWDLRPHPPVLQHSPPALVCLGWVHDFSPLTRCLGGI